MNHDCELHHIEADQLIDPLHSDSRYKEMLSALA
jgi:hypothetical protein